jgi:hypothetical protein
MRWDGNVACMGEGRGEDHTGFWQGNLSHRLLGRSRQRWNDTIKIVGLEGGRGMDWLIWLRTGAGGWLLCMW